MIVLNMRKFSIRETPSCEAISWDFVGAGYILLSIITTLKGLSYIEYFYEIGVVEVVVSHSVYCVLVIAQQSEFSLFNPFKRKVKLLPISEKCYRFVKNATHRFLDLP